MWARMLALVIGADDVDEGDGVGVLVRPFLTTTLGLADGPVVPVGDDGPAEGLAADPALVDTTGVTVVPMAAGVPPSPQAMTTRHAAMTSVAARTDKTRVTLRGCGRLRMAGSI